MTRILELIISSILGAFGFVFARWMSQTGRSLGARRAKGRAQTDADMFYSGIAGKLADDGIVIMNMRGIILWANPAYCRLLGYALDEIIGRHPLSFAVPPEHRPDHAHLKKFVFDPQEFSDVDFHLYENIRKDGSRFWTQINTAFHTQPSGHQYAVLVCRDATAIVERERKLKETSAELAHLAEHDDLTGAANRTALGRFITMALAKVGQTGKKIGLIQLDLDNFKQINDTHGHAAGDAVLVSVVDRITAWLPSGSMIARLGGDEFAIACPDIEDLAALTLRCEALMRVVQHQITWNDITLNCHGSIGAALTNEHAKTADEVLLQSDFALYEAKQKGGNCIATYNKDLHHRYSQQMMLSRDLKQAVSNAGLEFHFQPVFKRKGGMLTGFETLARWTHPQHGTISPAEFLPVAQKRGILADVDFLAIDAAVALKSKLNSLGYNDLRVSFNASSEVLDHPGFLSRLTARVQEHGLRCPEIIVEVLETVVFGDDPTGSNRAKTMQALKKAGFVTVLDDFGIGQTGLAHLVHLEFHGIKTDASLTRDILTDETAEKVLSALINLCRDLGFPVIVEGVETAEQAKRLNDMCCYAMQGYLFERPMPEQETLIWLETQFGSAIAPAAAPSYLEANS